MTWLARKERHLGLSEGQRDRKTNPCAHSKCNTEEAKNMYLCYVTVIISLINNWLAVIMLTINYQNGCLDFVEPFISTSWKTLTTGTLVISALCL